MEIKLNNEYYSFFEIKPSFIDRLQIDTFNISWQQLHAEYTLLFDHEENENKQNSDPLTKFMSSVSLGEYPPLR